MEEQKICHSLEDLMKEAFSFSLELAYETLTEDGHYFDPRSNFTEDMDVDKVYAWADGLMTRHYLDKIKGSCSLQSFIDFDIETFEDSVEKDIALFKVYLEKVGKPKVLTKEDLRKRGYRGSIAGYTKGEDALYYINEYKKTLEEAQDKLKKAKTFDEKYDLEKTISICNKNINEKKSLLKTI